MNLPSAEQYLKIIDENAPGTLARLHTHKFLLIENLKRFEKGNYAAVFKTDYQSKNYAIRFFLDSEAEIFERYREIQSYLNARSTYWAVRFEFLDNEVFLDGEYYPALKIDWINSLSFTEYLDVIINDPSKIEELQHQLIELSDNLERNNIGHGNLNMKHIRFVKQQQGYVLKLIDYDSMFIPAFEGKDSVSSGTAGFQHPMRLASDFSETIDRFSFWIFITALEAFKNDAELWKNSKHFGFNKEEQILFTYRDLAFPDRSTAFQLLKKYSSNALKFYAGKLVEFCNSTSLANIETPRLYGEKDAQYVSTNKKPVVVSNPTNQASRRGTSLQTADVSPERVVAEKPLRIKEKSRKNGDRLPYLEVREEKTSGPDFLKEKKKKKPVVAIVLTAIVLMSIATYFVLQSPSAREDNEVVATNETNHTATQVQPENPVVQETVFTSANTTQFLFQLYQSYNKRDLKAILSNYADSLTQYYDANVVTKDKLSNIIKDLFIKPAYYECQPDIRTLQLHPQGDLCKLTVGVTETIKANKRSKAETYSSKIEYTVDRNLKIIAERNIE